MKIGVIGAGQLGRMLALAGIPLGAEFRFLDPNPESPARGLGEFHLGNLDDAEAIERLAADVDVLTCEVENVPADAVSRATRRCRFYPPVAALAAAQDRLAEKTLFRELSIPTPAFEAVDSLADLEQAVARVGLPCVLKTRRMGYDGRGQQFLRQPEDLPAAFERLGGTDLILEGFVAFDYELSVVGARGEDGAQQVYPLSRNDHEDGILRRSEAPFAPIELQAEANRLWALLCGHLDYVGVLTIEFFCKDGQLIANEIAPRVHNSGHWTIEGAVTSQFENHIRAVTGLPLGDASATGHSVMLNCLGSMPPRDSVLAVPGAHYHDYGKSPRDLRKVGHITVNAPDRETCLASVRRLAG